MTSHNRNGIPTHIKPALHGNVTKRPFAHYAKSVPTHAFSPESYVHGEFAFRLANFWLEKFKFGQCFPGAGATEPTRRGYVLEVLRVDAILENEPVAGHVDRGGRDGHGEGDGDDSGELHDEAGREGTGRPTQVETGKGEGRRECASGRRVAGDCLPAAPRFFVLMITAECRSPGSRSSDIHPG